MTCILTFSIQSLWPSNYLVRYFLQDNRTSQVPLDIEDDSTSVRSNEVDNKGNPTPQPHTFFLNNFFPPVNDLQSPAINNAQVSQTVTGSKPPKDSTVIEPPAPPPPPATPATPATAPPEKKQVRYSTVLYTG